MSPVIQASEWRIVLTWVMACCSTSRSLENGIMRLGVFAGSVHRQVRGPFELNPRGCGRAREFPTFNVRERAAAMTSRVGVCVGAFRAHPPVNTQTRDTRLLCDRGFPKAHRRRAAARDLLRDSQEVVVAERADGHCASRPWGRRVPEQSGNVTAQCPPAAKSHTQKDTRQKQQHKQQAQTRRYSPSLPVSLSPSLPLSRSLTLSISLDPHSRHKEVIRHMPRNRKNVNLALQEGPHWPRHNAQKKRSNRFRETFAFSCSTSLWFVS